MSCVYRWTNASLYTIGSWQWNEINSMRLRSQAPVLFASKEGQRSSEQCPSSRH